MEEEKKGETSLRLSLKQESFPQSIKKKVAVLPTEPEAYVRQ